MAADKPAPSGTGQHARPAAPDAFQTRPLRGIARFFAACLLLLALLLAALGLLFTGIFPNVLDGEVLEELIQTDMLFSPHTVLQMIPALVLACAEVAILYVIWRYVRLSSRVMIVAACAVLLVAQMVWVTTLGTTGYIYPDSNYLIAGGSALSSGDYAVFSDGSFVCINMHWYPFQSGGIYLFSLFWREGVHDPYLAFQTANALCNTGTATLLYWICCLLSDDERARRLVCALLVICLPLVFSCAFVYGNAIGLFFSILACALLVYAVRAASPHRAAAGIGCAAALFVGRVAKSTVTLFFIPLALTAFLVFLDRRKVKALAVTAVLVVLLAASSSLPVRALQAQTQTDFGQGLPTIGWLQIGLDHDADTMPGWWTGVVLEQYETLDGDYQAQKDVAGGDVRSDLAFFAHHPRDAAYFFGKKISTEWTDPTYQSIYYSSLSEPAATGICRRVIDASAAYDNLLGWHLDAYQLIVYAGLLAYAWQLFRSRSIRHRDMVLPVVLLAGAFVYLLWEAKSVYVFPYFMLMIPLASIGIGRLFERGKSGSHPRGGRHGQTVAVQRTSSHKG